MSQKVVIIGHGYTARLGMVRSLGSCGYEINVIVMTNYLKDGKTLNTKKPIDCYSKYVNNVYYCFSDRELLIQLLLAKCTDPQQKVIIIPDSDFSAATIDLNQERLKDHFLFPHINHKQGAVVEWMDKLRQKEKAKAVGLNVANSWVINVRNGEYEISDDIQYPCFPKPLATIEGGKAGLKRCDDSVSLCRIIDGMVQKRKNFTVLVEKYMQIETEYAILGFSDGDKVIIPCVIQILSLANGGHFGVAKQGKIMPIDGFEALILKFQSFVRETGFVGVYDIDFYRCEGDFYFGEMNLRYGGSGYAVVKMGVNLPLMLARTLCGEGIDTLKTTINSSATYVNERMCKDDWLRAYISTSEFMRLLHASDIRFIRDDEDPLPEKMFLKDNWNLISNAKRLGRMLLNIIN